MEKIKILILITEFSKKFVKHKHLMDTVEAIEQYAEVKYWHKNGDILKILDEIRFKPDFIYHYDIAWGNGYGPDIKNLDKIDIPKGCYVCDVHYPKEIRINYFEKNKIDLIFSASKERFLKVFPQYKNKFVWLPPAINPEVIRDWKFNKTCNYLLMGQVYYEDKDNPPKRVPKKGRYKFREKVLEKMKKEHGFLFHPHPGHRAVKSDDLLVNEKYAMELNKSKIFFTCGGEYKYPVPKFLEAPGSRTLLLAKSNNDVKDLGFKDRVNFVSCDESDFYDKALYYLRNEKERKRITNNGYKFIHKYHTNNVRAEQFVNHIKQFLSNDGVRALNRT